MERLISQTPEEVEKKKISPFYHGESVEENALERRDLTLVLKKILYRFKGQEVGRYGSGMKSPEEIVKNEQSNAEHLANMSALLEIFFDLAEEKNDTTITQLNFRECQSIINVHDLPENETEDRIHRKNEDEKDEEARVARELSHEEKQGEKFGQRYDSWQSKRTNESRFVKVLDTLEALVQMIYSRRMELYRYKDIDDLRGHAGKYYEEFPTAKAVFEHVSALYEKRLSQFREGGEVGLTEEIERWADPIV